MCETHRHLGGSESGRKKRAHVPHTPPPVPQQAQSETDCAGSSSLLPDHTTIPGTVEVMIPVVRHNIERIIEVIDVTDQVKPAEPSSGRLLGTAKEAHVPVSEKPGEVTPTKLIEESRTSVAAVTEKPPVRHTDKSAQVSAPVKPEQTKSKKQLKREAREAVRERKSEQARRRTAEQILIIANTQPKETTAPTILASKTQETEQAKPEKPKGLVATVKGWFGGKGKEKTDTTPVAEIPKTEPVVEPVTSVTPKGKFDMIPEERKARAEEIKAKKKGQKGQPMHASVQQATHEEILAAGSSVDPAAEKLAREIAQIRDSGKKMGKKRGRRH